MYGFETTFDTFGGDPDKVTIAGLSAGGFSVTGHMLSPMSDGLFKNVIAVSGALAWQKKLKNNNIDAARDLAQKCNCSTENVESMTICLVSVSVEMERSVSLCLIINIFRRQQKPS